MEFKFVKASNTLQWQIALNRFGLGAKFDQPKNLSGSPVRWLKNQILKPNFSFDPRLPSSSDVIYQQFLLRNTKLTEKRRTINQNLIKMFETQVINMLQIEVETNSGFEIRVKNFFSNHFSVSGSSNVMSALAPTLEREAIAPNLFGNYEDLLIAVVKHPAMLRYLDNDVSYGPKSSIGLKKNKGINENLAREILELHTLGVAGAYSLSDIQSLALGITGWTIGYPENGERPTFKFRQNGHEPGTVFLLNKRFEEGGLSQGEKMLKHICRHPDTAKHICNKLVFYFLGPIESNEIVDHLTKVWRETNGNIAKIFTALIEYEHSWFESKIKFKRPREYVVSTIRSLPTTINYPTNEIKRVLTEFGQAPFFSNSPAGFELDEEYWNTPLAIINRIEWVASLVVRDKKIPTDSFFRSQMTPKHKINKTLKNIKCHNPTEKIFLYLASPEFMRT